MSQMRRVGEEVQTKVAIRPVSSAAATVNGIAVDRSGAQSCALHHFVGAETGAPTSRTVSSVLQDSADGSTGWANITGTAPTDLTAVNTEAKKSIDLTVTVKQFIRVVTTVAFVGGTTPAILIGAVLVLGGNRSLPKSG